MNICTTRDEKSAGSWQFLEPAKAPVLFVFGAGASIADGAPLKEHILPHIIYGGDRNITESELGREVIHIITSNFAVSKESCPSLEAVFGYLEYFIKRRESLGGKFTAEKIMDIKNGLIQLIHHVIGKQRKTSKRTYIKFWDWIAQTSKNISIITMNYDTLLEEAFEPLFPHQALIDYCIRFMNYEHKEEIDHFLHWINPREPVWVRTGDQPKPIKIIKLHGSLNWKYCNCCNQVLLTPGDIGINLSSRGFVRRFGASEQDISPFCEDFLCPLDNTRFNTLIMPPSYIKELEHPIINILLDEASREIRSTRKIIFVGYSFSDADVHVKALFKKNIMAETEIYIVNPDLKQAQKSGYESLSNRVSYISSTFEDFIENNDLQNIILAPEVSL